MLLRSNAPPPSWLAAHWLPALGGLLAALGFACLLGGSLDLATEVLRPPGAAAQTLPVNRADQARDVHDAGWRGATTCWVGATGHGGSCSVVAPVFQMPVATRSNRPLEALTRPARSGGKAACWGKTIDRGTRSESAHLSSLPLCPDPRHTLLAIAATQHNGRGFGSRHTDDDGIWTALFALALTHQPVAPRGAKHLALPISTPETSDVRESSLESVGARR